MPEPLVVAILGPTTSGKSALSLELASSFGGEIINCDSTAVYRGFDIGNPYFPVMTMNNTLTGQVATGAHNLLRKQPGTSPSGILP